MSTWSPADLLPGLVCLLLAALLLAALRRWYDPVPHRIAAVFALVLLALFGPALFGGKILLPLDNLRGHVPFQHLPPTPPVGNLFQGDLIQLIAPSQSEVRRALAEGRWPLWNPRAGLGVPLLADPQAQALQPLQLTTWFLPVPRAAGVTAALRVLLALVFTFLLLRRAGLQNCPGKRLGEGPALAGALAFSLGGFVLLWAGWPIATSAVLLPALLYALARLDQEGGRRDLLLLALVTAALLLGGHPETIATVLLFALLVLLVQVRHRRCGSRLALLRGAALAFTLAAMLAAPALLPTLEALPHSLRAARLAEPLPDPAQDPAGRTFPERLARRALLAIAPNAFGNTRHIHYWGPANSNEDAGAFAGTAALLLAALALLPLPGKPKLPGGPDVPPPRPGPTSGLPDAERSAPSPVGFWAPAVAIAGLLLAARPPGLDLLFTVVPPLRALLTPRLLLFTGFGVAVLAALGLERLQRQVGTDRPRRRAVLFLVLALALAALIAWAYLAHPDPQGLDRLAVFRDGWLRWQLRFLAAAALLATLASLRRDRWWPPPAAAFLIVAELLLAHRPANPPMPAQLAWPVDPALQFLEERLRQDPGARIAGLGRTFPPNLAGLYGLADARVYNPAAPLAFFTATAPLVERWWGEVPEWGYPGHPLYPRLGVRYLLTAPDEQVPRLALVFEGETASVFETSGAWPRVALTPWPPLPRAGEGGRDGGAAGDTGGYLALAELKIGEAWISATVPAAGTGETDGGASPLSRSRERGPGGEGLASNLLQDGNWHLLADGRLQPPASDSPFFAAPLPSHTRRIDLLYRPRTHLAGCFLAALGLAAGLAALVPRPGRATIGA
jgi:hypothetical protein